MNEVMYEQVFACELTWVRILLEKKPYAACGQSCHSIEIGYQGCWRSFVMHAFIVPDGVTFTYPQQPVPDWEWLWHALLQRAWCLHSSLNSDREAVLVNYLWLRSYRWSWEWWFGVAESSTRVTGGWCNESYSSSTSHCNTSSWQMHSATSCATSCQFRSARWSELRCSEEKRRWRWTLPKREDEDEFHQKEKMKMKMSTVLDYSNCILDLYRLVFSDVHCLYMGKFWGKSKEFSVWDSSVFLHLLRLTFRFFFSSSL